MKIWALLPMLKVAICLMSGIVVGFALYDTMGVYQQIIMLVAIILPFVLALIFHKRPMLSTAAMGASVFFIGMWLAVNAENRSRVVLPTQMVEYDAVVFSEPQRHGKVIMCDLLLLDKGKGAKVRTSILCDTVSERYRRLHVGDGINAYSLLEQVESRGADPSPTPPVQEGSNSGGADPPPTPPEQEGSNGGGAKAESSTFDYGRWMHTHGYVASTFIYHSNWRKAAVSLDNLSTVTRLRIKALKLRQQLVDKLVGDKGSQDEMSVIIAMTLGDKSLLTKELKETYSVTSASHVLALSGLHLSILYGVLMLLLGYFRRRIWAQAILLTTIWAYAWLVGLSPSVVRAATMLSIYSIFVILYRERVPLNVLSLAAIITLVFNPFSILDVGFQLSYTAVVAILLFVPLFMSRVEGRGSRVTPPSPPGGEFFRSRVAGRESRVESRELRVKGRGMKTVGRMLKCLYGMLAVTLAAQLGTGPLVAYHFGRFSCVFLLSSFIAIPLVTLILWATLLFFATGWIPVVQLWIGDLLTVLARLLNSSLTSIAALPGASIENITLSPLQVVGIYTLIIAAYCVLIILIRRKA